jgi:enoyl-CoA hydratase
MGLSHGSRGRRLLSAPMALTPDAALDLLRSPFALEDMAGTGTFVVDAGGGSVDLDAVAATLRALPCVTVAVAPGASPDLAPAWVAPFDVVVTEADVDDITTAVERNPMASLALAQLLRAGDALDVWGGLFAESTAYSMLQAGPEFARWMASRPAVRADPPDGPTVVVAREGAKVHVTLNRPTVHNAFDTATRDELVTILRAVAADPSVAEVHLDGAGPSFCSGGDLDEFGTLPDPATAHRVRMTRSPAWWLAQCAARTSVALHGACIGAGIELAAFARDLTATEDARFQLPEVAFGLVPGAGGTVSLPRRIGRQRTAWLALSGRRIDATTALAWGLVDRVSGRPHRR